MVLHGNRPEDLRALLVAWLRAHPLAPLENEVVLVQSNGIAQWLKLALAADPGDPAGGGLGITAAMELQLPAQFLWRAYRAVLGRDSVPERSPLDEAPLTWRLMRLLPALLAQPGFEPLARFLEDGRTRIAVDGRTAAPPAWPDDLAARKCHQLAQRLADLFDQYQVYRADWLQDWAQGRDRIQTLRHGAHDLPEDQCWQARLWRALLADVGPEGLAGSRAGVHQRFLDALAAQPALYAPGLPRRVVVFGISALPAQTLQALHALAGQVQVMLFVHNPCRHHWTDIVADQDLLRGAYKRQARRPGMPLLLDEAALHQHAHPLLAAWGKQGRDYLHLVDSIDEPERYRAAWQGVGAGRIDLFSEDEPPAHGLLQQLQDDILNLRPLAETRALWPAVVPAKDLSLRFHSTHSAQREVEVLHDQLLARFDADPTLQPRDVIVMLPAVDAYAPHIEAVFGRLPRGDARHIPYTVADQGPRGQEPLVVALELLLRLPDSRLTASDVLDLLEVGALRRRFGLADEALPTLNRWIAGAGVRWGLDAAQREQQALGAAGEVNSWRFGLSRMLLGYAVGEGAGGRTGFDGIEPYGEVGGLDAAAVGPLAALLRALEDALQQLAAPAAPAGWAERLRALLTTFFAPAEAREQLRIQQLQQGLDAWLDECSDAGFSEELPLAVVRERWLAALESHGLQQRFMTGGVSFCTLMPMRAIPFRVVCLLGMNDGEFPRPAVRADFDLMQSDWRPGDRSRRDDDRYLLLEALLSARDQLYISWVGRDVRDHSERAPSVLIGQLRDHVAAGWRLAGHEEKADALLPALSTEHPLQPFSPRYFAPDAPPAPALDGFYSYGREWQAAHGAQDPAHAAGEAALPPVQPERALSLRQLADFLAQPVEAFFAQRLQVRFDADDEEALDDEVFALDGLQNWQLEAELRAALQPWADAQPSPRAARAQIDAALAEHLAPLLRAGRLPLRAFGELAAQQLARALRRTLEHYLDARVQWPRPEPQAHALRWADSASGLRVEDALPARHLPADVGDETATPAHIALANGRLHRGQELSWQHIVRHWPAHLALQIAAGPTRTVLASETGLVRLAPMDARAAQATLAALVQGWAEGMRQPLPLACRTGFMALIEDDAGGRRTAQTYDGNFQMSGEGTRTALARVYPDFARLQAAQTAPGEGFDHWVQQLYRPLWDAIESAKPQAGDVGEGEPE